MSRGDRGARPAPLAGVAVCAGTATILVVAGRPPTAVLDLARDLVREAPLVTSREVVTVVLLSLVWLIVSVIVLVAAVSSTKTAWRRVRRLVATMSRDRRRVVGAIAVFVGGLVGSLRSTTDRTVVASEFADPGTAPDGHGDATGSRTRRPGSGDAGTLPVLASAGLAAGVVAHVQRRRAELLSDAPSTARLARPSAASQATGTALFERAKSIDPALSKGTIPGPTTNLVVPLGVDGDRLVTVSLRAGDTLSVDGHPDEALDVVRHLLNTVVLAPWLDRPFVILDGFDLHDAIVGDRVVVVGSSRDAIDRARGLKSSHPGSHVVVVTRSYEPEFEGLSPHGILVVGICAGTSRPVTRIVREPGGWRVSTTDERFRPYGASLAEVDRLRTATGEMTVLEVDELPARVDAASRRALLRVLGPVEGVGPAGREIVFHKSKSMELLCWLAFHRDRPTVAAARTALWEVDVRDATFHNVLSELRRGLAAVGMPDAAGRRGKHRLFLDAGITSDAEVLRGALRHAERSPTREAARDLCETLALVRGLPFGSCDYDWADAEGVTSTLYWLVMRSIEHVVGLLGPDTDDMLVMEATAAGLRMAPGDETLLTLLRRTPLVAPTPTA